MEEFIATFHIDWMAMLAQVLNFGLVFLALYVLAAKPLRKLIAERGEEIARGLDNAKLSYEIKENADREYKEALARAHKEANDLFEKAKTEANKKKEDMLAKAKDEVDTLIANGKKNLELEKSKMLDDAKKELASLVILATEKAIEEKNK